jgi:hypothetical protein
VLEVKRVEVHQVPIPPPVRAIPASISNPSCIPVLENSSQLFNGKTEGLYRIGGQFCEIGPSEDMRPEVFSMMHQPLRVGASPGRWSDLRGNTASEGTVMGYAISYISLGLILTSSSVTCHIPCIYTVHFTAKISRVPRKTGLSLDGDSIHRWDQYESLDRARAAIWEAVQDGWGVEKAWLETEEEHAGLVGKLVVEEHGTKRKAFVVLGLTKEMDGTCSQNSWSILDQALYRCFLCVVAFVSWFWI